VALTKKRLAFAEFYLKEWNATKAADLAHFAHPGSQGHRLLKNVEIQEYIQRRLTELTMGADEVLIRLAEQARASSGQFIDDKGKIDWAKVKEQGHLIKGISQTSRGDRIELYDAQSALALIGKHHALFTERVEHVNPLVLKVVYDDGNADTPEAPAPETGGVHPEPEKAESD
jgi:hypothetical protein